MSLPGRPRLQAGCLVEVVPAGVERGVAAELCCSKLRAASQPLLRHASDWRVASVCV